MADRPHMACSLPPKRLPGTRRPAGLTPVLILLLVSRMAAGQEISRTERATEISAGGTVLVTYVHGDTPAPEGTDPRFHRSAYIHPLCSPSGVVLTRIQPPDHYHHYGIWNPWTHVRIDGERYDFWNLGDGLGRVRFVQYLATTAEEGRAGFRSEHVQVFYPGDGSEKVAIRETWDVAVHDAGERSYILDLTITQCTPLENGLLLEQYRYGGLGYRATAKWGAGNSTILTSEGKTRNEADASRARWVIIEGESEAPQGRSGILFLSHPSNREHPEPIRTWDAGSQGGTGNLFFNFTPIREREWSMVPGKTYTLRYRLVVFDGPMTTGNAEGYWEEFIREATP